MVNGDIGGADEIHGEAGDDIAYGGAGSDVMFGDAQDDDLIGGYGNDWISGGTGDDGILGDDGRIFTSRNGTPEPLSGVATATTQALIEGNGNGTINWTTYVTGSLQKNVDLTPFNLDPDHTDPDMLYDPLQADDIIFGGLGRDFIHAGSGDDAVSGAEALNEAYFVRNGALVRSDFNRPNNPGDTLDYNETSTLFAQYDADNPMRRIVLNANGTLATNNVGKEFFLNFDPTEGPLAAGSTTAHTDGDDIVFGDHGNDWLVGGTGRDNVFGGWGDDLINVDDDHRTGNGLNLTPDAEGSYADIALGGAGRDVLIANSSGDNMVDTSGEFNSFLVPFSKFGPPTVNRAINPQMEEFLYSLGQADGADQTRPTPGATGTGSGSAARHGEPFGELALVTPQDGASHDQHGGPRDPQAGNQGGTQVDKTTTTSNTITSAPASTGSTTTGTTTITSTTSGTTPTGTTTTGTTTTGTTTTGTTTTATKGANKAATAAVPLTTAPAPSIDWAGKTASITTLPWAQGLQSKPIGLSVPSFDDVDDDDDLIDWSGSSTAAPVKVTPSTTPTVSASPKKK
jgi:Ca2+-binding RTX toxin-like protein